MQSRSKSRALRAVGGVIAALAIVPWLGAAAASASSASTDSSCATRPGGVDAGASCSLLVLPNSSLSGEAWVVRTTGNDLAVWVFALQTPDGATPVTLCAQSSGPYAPTFACPPGSAIVAGSSTAFQVGLTDHGIGASDPVYYAIRVVQGSSVAVSNGVPGTQGTQPTSTSTSTSTPKPSKTSATPTPTRTSASPSPSDTTTSTSPSPSDTTTSTSPSPSDTTTSTSPSPSDTTTSTSPSPSDSSTSASPSGSTSVLPTKLTNSPSTSVLPTTLAHTGGNAVGGTVLASLALLGLGGVLVVAGRTVPASARRRH